MNARTEHDRTCGIWFQSVVISKRHTSLSVNMKVLKGQSDNPMVVERACPFAAERDVES